jgi:putative DNA methylase
MTYRKKLIEVALPLEAINMESAREKSIRHGHPSTLHLWWARRPLAACRAVLWSSLVDDPSSWPERFTTEEDQKRERQRLFDILGRITIETDRKGKEKQVVRGLVSWDDIKDPAVIEEAQREIARSLAWGRGEEPPTKPEAVREYIAQHAPPVYDPFAGGGSIPLEAQRLGLEAHASDLNPVAVLINKALIEIPPKFKDMPPVNPEDRQRAKLESWKGAQGLAADVRYYGKWMRDEAFKRIGHLYPPVQVVRQEDGTYRHATAAELAEPKKSKVEELTVIAWIWARTVKCPNPACGCEMPLVRNFQLSTKAKNLVWVQPIIDRKQNPPEIEFRISNEQGDWPKGTISRRGSQCLACDTPVPVEYIRDSGRQGKMGTKMLAIVAERDGKRLFLNPCDEHEKITTYSQHFWKPEFEIASNSRYMTPTVYGMKKFSDLFTERQLIALSTLQDSLIEVREKISTITELQDYADAVFTYLALMLSKLTDTLCALATWQPNMTRVAHAFTRQALPISWDFVETSIFNDSAGDFYLTLHNSMRVLDNLPRQEQTGSVAQCDARNLDRENQTFLFSTDPPYYDAVPYADLSDFFYVWIRENLRKIYPELLGTLLTPKDDELVADPFREGSKEKAKDFFEKGLKEVFSNINDSSLLENPVSIYYAFKQAENDKDVGKDVTASTGWETMIEGLLQSHFSIVGTWPLRTELSNRVRGQDSNALASSIVLVCRPRPTDAPKATRRQFLTELKRELPKALKTLQQGNIAPVDLAQASIGPGMAIFSKYAAVLESDGTPMRVRTALQLINQILDEFQSEQEGEFDSDTRWAIAWFEQHQYADGPYGQAETLSTARNTSVKGMAEAGILVAKGGKVRLLKRDELPTDWQPEADHRTPDWEATQHLIRTLLDQGELAAAELLARLATQGENARDLAYRLYTICDRKGWAAEGVAYNSLVIAWPEISRLASEYGPTEVQGSLL